MYVGPENKGYSQLTAMYKNKDYNETNVSIDGVQGTVLITDENVSIGK